MDYTLLGASGLPVSRIALGCMSFGRPGTGRDWALDADAAESIFRQAVELGITFWDTANVYSAGTSEEITGEAIDLRAPLPEDPHRALVAAAGSDVPLGDVNPLEFFGFFNVDG